MQVRKRPKRFDHGFAAYEFASLFNYFSHVYSGGTDCFHLLQCALAIIVYEQLQLFDFLVNMVSLTVNPRDTTINLNGFLRMASSDAVARVVGRN